MFQVYFGAFDVAMYAIAVMFAIGLANAICHEMDEREQVNPQGIKEVSTTQSAQISTQPVEQTKETPLILDAQLFELRGQLVVRKGDIPDSVPTEIKTFFFRGDPVIWLTDLLKVCGIVAIEADQVIRKWEQWSQQKKKKESKKRHRSPIREAASLNGGAGHGLASTLTV